jgi:peptidylprolyl isomerase
VGTQKRERQKANRQQRLIEDARAERVSSVRRNVLRVTLVVGIAVLGVIVIAWIGGAFSGDDDEPVDAVVTVPEITGDEATADEAPVDTQPVPDLPKPTVEIPAEIPTELAVTELSAGSGPEATMGDTVSVFYVGVRSEDGTEFDTNYGGGRPFPVTLGLGSVIAGWEEGLLGVQEGGQYQLDIPAELAYGEQGAGEIIEPGDALTFVVDVVSVEPGPTS